MKEDNIPLVDYFLSLLSVSSELNSFFTGIFIVEIWNHHNSKIQTVTSMSQSSIAS